MPNSTQNKVDGFLDDISKSWGKIVVILGLVSAGVSTFLKYIESKSWLEIGLVLFITLVVIFLAIKRIRDQQKTEWKSKQAETSDAAFRGLLPFEEGDSETFFGREIDIGTIQKKVCHSDFRFGVLTDESGCGKTSLLKAGLIPNLQEAGYLPVYLRLYGDPEVQIRQAVGSQTGVSNVANEGLQEYLQRICEEKQQTLVLICDQFEEFFISHPVEANRQPFLKFVGRCYDDQTLAVKFLFSLRKDFADEITEFDDIIPEPLSSSKRHKLRNFDINQAEMIIQQSVDKAGLPFEPGLCNVIAQDLVIENQVLPAELQIVCYQLQNLHIYSIEQYQFKGGKESLVYAFLEEVIENAGNEKDVKLVLRSMISEEDTKLTQTLEKIAETTQQSKSQVEKILRHFVGERLVREIQDDRP